MCGIAGVVGPTVTWGPAFAERALRLQHHRGPDGSGRWSRVPDGTGPQIEFAHNRLAIVDLSPAGAQPMHHAAAGLTIVFNGEIYNDRLLVDRLSGLGHRFRSTCDTEVVLAAYAEWGTRCVDELDGMFAFAVWDEPRSRLFAARDRLGEKPFHYVWDESNRTFAFASEIKALAGLPGVRVEIHDGVLARWARAGSLAAGSETVVRPIRRLEPGHTLTLDWSRGADASQLATSPFWTLPSGTRGLGLDAGAERVLDLLSGSVESRLRSDVPVGSSLSGGLDSSAVVCLIHRLRPDTGQATFTARMDQAGLDEGRWVDAIVAATGVRNEQVWPRHQDLVEHFDRWCWHLEEPVRSTSPFAQYLVMRLASEHGVVVLLDGQGADEMFGGYVPHRTIRLNELLARRRFVSLAGEVWANRRRGLGPFPISAKAALARLSPALYQRLRPAGPASSVVGAGSWRSDWVDAHPDGAPPERGTLDAVLRYELTGGPLQDLLRYGDRNSMAWSREVRQPFLAHGLVELAATLDPALKVSHGESKRVLRQAVRGLVPDVVVDRTDKLGYQAPLATWLDGPLKPWLEERGERAREVLGDRISLDRLRAHCSAEARTPSTRDHAEDLFGLVVAGATLGAHLEHEPLP